MAVLVRIASKTGKSLDWLLGLADEVPRPVATDLPSRARAAAPSCIPDSERERFSWLAVALGHDYRLPTGGPVGWNRKVDAALRVLTAPLAEVRRGRGERAAKPETLLEALRTWSPEHWRDYVLFSLLAADRMVHPARVPPTRPPKPTRKARRRVSRRG